MRSLPIASVLAAMALVVLDAAMVGVALPTIAGALDITPAQAVRIVFIYQLALLMCLLPAGRLGEAFGHRRVFMTGLAMFMASAIAAAWAPSFSWLIAARFMQGVGGSAIMALGIALLRQGLADGRLGAAIGWNALNVALCSAAGPTIAAAFLSIASWKCLFLIHLPLGLFALLCASALPRVRGTRQGLDLGGMVLCMMGSAGLLLGINAVASRPAGGSAMIAAAIVAFSLLIRRERGVTAPLIPVDLLRQRNFSLSVTASVCCFAGQTMGMLALPFYLQGDLGLRPLETGLTVTAWPAAVALSALIAGRASDGFPSGTLPTAGCALLALGLAAAAAIPSPVALTLASCAALCGLGFGLFQVPNNRTMFLAAPPSRSGAAGGLQGSARLMGQAIGATCLAVALTSKSLANGPRTALAVGALFALAAALIALWQAHLAVRAAPAAA